MSNYDLLQTLLDEKIEDIGTGEITEYTLRDYLEDKTIKAIEDNIIFFDDIPKNELSQVFEELLEILFRYDTNKRSLVTSKQFSEIEKIIKEIDKGTNLFHDYISNEPEKKPINQLKQDITTIQKYQLMIERLYGGTSKKDDTYIFINIPTEISQTYQTNKKIIIDLETRVFEIIPRRKYYPTKKQTKTEIKIFLDDLVVKYNLKNITDYKKPLIDSI